MSASEAEAVTAAEPGTAPAEATGAVDVSDRRRFPTCEDMALAYRPELAYLFDARQSARPPSAAELAVYAQRAQDPAYAFLYAPGAPSLLGAPRHAAPAAGPVADAPRPLPEMLPAEVQPEAEALPVPAVVPGPAVPDEARASGPAAGPGTVTATRGPDSTPDTQADTQADKAGPESESAQASGPMPADTSTDNAPALGDLDPVADKKMAAFLGAHEALPAEASKVMDKPDKVSPAGATAAEAAPAGETSTEGPAA